MIELGKEDDGFERFTIGEQKFEVDVYDVIKYIRDIAKARKSFDPSSGTPDIIADIKKFLTDVCGIKKPSYLHAVRFVKKIFDSADDLKKNTLMTA